MKPLPLSKSLRTDSRRLESLGSLKFSYIYVNMENIDQVLLKQPLRYL